MGEPNLVVLIWFKFILEAQRIIVVCTFSSPVAVIEESMIIALVGLNLDICSSNFRIARNIVLSVGHLLASSEPLGAILFMLLFGPYAGFHADLVKTGSLG